MSVTKTKRGPGSELGPALALCAIILVILVGVGVWAADVAGAVLAGLPAPPGNPAAAVIDLLSGEIRWPGAWADAAAVLEVLLVAGLGVLGWRLIGRNRSTRTRVDAAAQHLASRRELQAISQNAAQAAAARLGAAVAWPGVRIGPAIGSGVPLYGTGEDEFVFICGPRVGKTSCYAIPALVEAPGPAIATSNKRDLLDHTRGVREQHGIPWVFDPQSVAGEAQVFWWNPLSYVGSDIDKAKELSAVFAGFHRDDNATPDPYFDPEGQDLLAFLLLAASEACFPITRVYRWVTNPTDPQPADILTEHGHAIPADSVNYMMALPDKQKAGLYGTAKSFVSCLANPAITRWVVPNDALEQFHPAQFVRDPGAPTLYLLSREGRGTAGALVTALVKAVLDAAEEYAATCPAGRLPVPLLAVLDEAANICRIKELPQLYSHYGSRGIVALTFLQSWAQGVGVWGKLGMEALFSAANFAIYGGGVREPEFLQMLVQLIGEFEPETGSVSIQHGNGYSRSTQFSTRTENILDVADLAALPRGRAIVLSSGQRPALVGLEPWFHGSNAPAIHASLERYAPGARPEPDSGLSEQGPQAEAP